MENLEENIHNLSLCFRNRLNIFIKAIVEKKNLDAVLLILSYDSLYNQNVSKVVNWLIFGYSSLLDLEEKSLPFSFNETFLIITKASIFIYSNLETKSFLRNLTSKINDINIDLFFPSKQQQENTEILQILKISKFYEKIKEHKYIGIPLKIKEKMNIIELEKWPLINSYGLDSIGGGFFTMKHQIADISFDLEALYHIYDIYSCITLVSERTGKMETVLSDFFIFIDRETINKRLEKSENALNENQELDFLVINYFNLLKTKFQYLQNLPGPRVLYGTNTNKGFADFPSTDAICKNSFDYKIPGFHLIYENYDPITGIRIGRSFFTTSFQKLFLKHNEEELFSYFESAIYKEAFYLFNIYFLFIEEYKFYQFDLITNKISIEIFKKKLSEKINSYIKKTFNKTQNTFDYFLTEDKIIINTDEYINFGNYNINDNSAGKKKLYSNRIKILRIEVKDIISPISLKLIGGLLYCDSFIICHDEIHNLTHDILPFKAFYTSHFHMLAKDGYSYEPIKIITQNSVIKFNDIQFKGLSFFREEYNIPYLFPSSKELGFDSDQMFVFLEGKIAVFSDAFLLYENSLGNLLIEDSNILEIEHKNANNFSVLLFKLKDSEKFALSGIIKKEVLLYLPAVNSSLKFYNFEMIDFLKIRYKSIFKTFSARKYEEYELAIKNIDDNKYFNLNYISNTFSYANILDAFYELLDYEIYLCRKCGLEVNENISYEKYKNTLLCKNIDLVESINNTKKNKILFLYCDILSNSIFYNYNNTSNGILELFKQLGITYNINVSIVVPYWELLDDQEKLCKFYADNFNKIKANKKNNVIIACIFNNYKIRNFVKLFFLKYFKDFFDEFEVLNFAYYLNLEYTKQNKNKTPCTNLYNLNDELFSYLITEDDLVVPEKIQKRLQYLNDINLKVEVLNTRSFIKNTKDTKKFFEFPNKNFEFLIKEYLGEPNNPTKAITKDDINSLASDFDSVYIELEYKLDEVIFKKYAKRIINNPILYCLENNFFLKEQSISDATENNTNNYKKFIELENANAQMTDKEYQDLLNEQVFRIKRKELEGEIYAFTGKVRFFNNDEKYLVKINYHDMNINKLENEKKAFEDRHGLLFIGKNLKNNVDNLKKFVYFLSGKMPEFKKYRTKKDMTEQEIMNLNLLYFEKELPEGWYVDGPVFVDPNDNRHSHHPNIDQFIEEFLRLTNLAVDKYNEEVQKQLNEMKIKIKNNK